MNEKEKTILTEFTSLKQELKSWGDWVDKAILDLLHTPFEVEHRLKMKPVNRLKDDKSFISKALWRSKPYENPILEIEDKVGTRVVLLSTLDVDQASKALLEYSGWSIKPTKNLYSIRDDKPDEFTYLSNHFVVCPVPSDERWPQEIHSLLTCEVQVRTLLQHAYAEISHDSAYKGPYKNDKEIARNLAKSMALMEATDDYFCSIFKMISDESRFYSNYLRDLSSLFIKHFNKDYLPVNQDIEVANLVFNLLDLKPVSFQDLEEFIQKESVEVSQAIKPENGQIFEQPISILIAYYFLNHRFFLNENWPLNLESLKAVYRAFNTSFKGY